MRRGDRIEHAALFTILIFIRFGARTGANFVQMEGIMKKMFSCMSVIAVCLVSVSAFAADLCKGKAPGSVTFFNREISRDSALPDAATELDFDGPMWALLCLSEAVGPQPEGGKKFRVVLYVKALSSPEGKYNTYSAKARQEGGIHRPELSKARKDMIVFINEDFSYKSLSAKLDPATYQFRLQAASEKATGKVDVSIDWSNDVAYFQELRKAGYLADGMVKVIKKE